MKHLNSFLLKTALLIAMVLGITFSAKADYDIERDGVYYAYTYYDTDLNDYFEYDGPHNTFPYDEDGDWMFGYPNNSTVAVTYGDSKYTGSVSIPSMIYLTYLWDYFTADVTSIGYRAFISCNQLTRVYLPSSIDSIGATAFYACTNLQSIEFGGNETFIGDHAFVGCTSLQSVTIPDGVKSLETECFWKCSNLKTVVIGSGMQSMVIGCFKACSSITSITCKAMTPPSIGSTTFDSNVYTNATLYVPADAVESYKSATYWKNFTNIKAIPGTGIDINATNFPDANFRSYMLSLYPQGYLTSSDINSLTSLNVANKGIVNMKGIELLTGLKELRCWGNSFSTLDLSSNTKLTYLDCAPNLSLTSLNVRYCPDLENLICYSTSIQSLNLAYNSKLKSVSCYNTKLVSLSLINKNQLASINVKNTPTLESLDCYNNVLTTLDVTGCTGLKSLKCYYNDDLTAITGLGDCKAITYLDCEDCAITDLSAVESMTNIVHFYGRNNRISSFSLNNKSQLIYVRISGNTNLTTLRCSGNSKLNTLYMQNCPALKSAWITMCDLSSLDVTGCTALNDLACWQNHISGNSMTILVNSLPTVSGTPGQFAVLDNVNEGNVITDQQVLAANRKNWVCKRWTGSGWEIISVLQPGDVDGNGYVNIADVSALIDILLSSTTSAPATADVNGDGHVNISDVSALIDILLGAN